MSGWVPSGTDATAEAIWSMQCCAASSAVPRDDSPKHSSGTRPCCTARATLLRVWASVSPKYRRRSACPISTYVHPTCRRVAALTSPVNGPEASADMFCPPVVTGTPVRISATSGRDGKLGKTASSALPWRTAALRAAMSFTSRVQATVRSWSRYIFRLVASSVVAGRDMSAAAAQFVVAEDLDFGGGRGRLVEAVGEPFPGQPACQLQADHPLSEGEHLGVVAQHQTFHRVAVVGGAGPHSGHLIGGHGHPHAGTADQQRPVHPAVGHHFGGGQGDGGVGRVSLFVHTDIGDGRDEVVGLEIGFDRLLIGEPCIIGADGDS